MNRLNTELSRLYLVPSTASPPQGRLVATNGTVKAMVMEIVGPANWAELSGVWHAVRDDLELPAAAIAVSGSDGLQLWFSVADAVSAHDAADFLCALQYKYLPSTPAQRIHLYPFGASEADGGFSHAREIPALHAATGNWSAFVSPDLASVFGDEPWLDIPPNPDQQADILSRLKSIKSDQFHLALTRLRATSSHTEPTAKRTAASPRNQDASPLEYGTGQMHPKEFLMQVMNDPAVSVTNRIEAAKALLPYAN